MRLGGTWGRPAAAMLAGLLVVTLSAAQPLTDVTLGEPIEFRLAIDILPKAGIMLANGVEVRPSDWQAVILARMPATSLEGERSCTGTLVGTNVVLLAAHCVDRVIGGSPRKARLTIDDGFADLDCNMHEAYAKFPPKLMDARSSEDFALCLLKLSARQRDRLEVIRTEVIDEATALPAGTKVLMSGYGCSNLRIVDNSLVYDRSDRLLRIGDAKVDSPAGAQPLQPTYLTIRSPEAASTALCPGDSGGPLFIGATAAKPDQERRIVGVNSVVRLESRVNNGGYDVISSIAATGNETFHDWALRWVKANESSKPIVCGVNRKAKVPPCRH